MSSLLAQIGAVASLNLNSLPQRAAMSAASVIAVALSIAVLLFFLALANGLAKTVEGSGSDDVAVALREGSTAELNSVVTREQLNILSGAPEVAAVDGAPAASGELLVIVDGVKRATGTKANIPFRGLGGVGLALRANARIVEGRMFAPGSNEIIVGASLLREFAGFELGGAVRLRGGEWRVVGVFDAPGTVFASELWADIAVTQSLFQRPNVFQTMRFKMAGPGAIESFRDFAAADARLKQLEIISEKEYFARQAAQSTGQFLFIAWALGVTMAIGSLAGALNTMYSAVASRAAETATLRLIGFSGFAAFAGTLLEAVMLSAIGGVIGVLIAFGFFQGRTTSTLGAGFTQLVFKFDLSPTIVIAAILMSVLIGLVGGFLPGLRAARQRPQLELAAQ
jgi:putative ABC transport system permease protein